MDTIDNKDLGTVEGFEITARLIPDPDASPYEADCYSSGDRVKWNVGLWQYVIVEVTASLDGHELGRDTLGAVEHGDLEEVSCDPLNDEHNPIKDHDMIANAVRDARKAANELRLKLDTIEPWPVDAPEDE